MADAPRVGLVLGAGGVAGGAFHAGMLSALEAVTGWDPRRAEIVVGTSAGSITGAALRAGLCTSDLLARAEGRPLSPEGTRLTDGLGTASSLPPLRPSRERAPASQILATLGRAVTQPFAARPLALLAGLLPEGAVSTSIISEGVSLLHLDEWPDDPLWICAVRRRDGRRTVFGRGEPRPSLPVAVAASCAIPGFFQPVEIDGLDYIDGGVHSPTNADVMRHRDLGLDLVIVSSPMSVAGGVRLAIDQAARRWSTLLLAAEVRRLRRRRIPVVVFQPTGVDAGLIGLNAMDPSKAGAIARLIHESTLRRLARADTKDRLGLIYG